MIDGNKEIDVSDIHEEFEQYKKEAFEKDRQKLNKIYAKREIKNVFGRNFDELHMKFLNSWQDKYGVLEDEQIFILRHYNEFQKTGIIK